MLNIINTLALTNYYALIGLLALPIVFFIVKLFPPSPKKIFFSSFYLIDKMQGHIFKFDYCFNYMDKRMYFGKSPSRLYDPIAIRNVDNKLYVLSWLTGNMVAVPLF